MRMFDTKVQELTHKVLTAAARLTWADAPPEEWLGIPEAIVPGKTATMRCCVHKERHILTERVRLALGGDKANRNAIEVIESACDECPMGGYEVTGACRGCIANRCEAACPKGAIEFDKNHAAYIDKERCVECGMCARVCPYGAILNFERPCERACKIGAITMDENKAAAVNEAKCVACGACVYQCPWGAIMDKSYITDVIKLLKRGKAEGFKVYAVVAPSVSSQFTFARPGQVVAGLEALGFHTVVEAALGADAVAAKEALELAEKGFLLSSCCPAFVDYVRKEFPQLAEHLSRNLSPAAVVGEYIKKGDPKAKAVFIGPCTAKKMEYEHERAAEFIDAALTFEELMALFDSREIDLPALPEKPLDNASYYGRIFARSGGLSDAVAQALKEQGITDFTLKPVACDGIEECRKALLRAASGNRDFNFGFNFIEGMACRGGCIGGAGCLTHGAKDKAEVDKYGRESYEKSILGAASVLVGR